MFTYRDGAIESHDATRYENACLMKSFRAVPHRKLKHQLIVYKWVSLARKLHKQSHA